MNEGMELSPSSLSASTPSVPSSSEVKSPTAFRTISEVAGGLALPQHVLRFWESKFPQIKPLKRGGGRRYYRPEDVKIIHDIKDLLYNQGFTIRGVQKLLREQGGTSIARSMVAQPALPASMHTLPLQPAAQTQTAAPQQAQQQSPNAIQRREIEGVLEELKALRKLLKQSGI